MFTKETPCVFIFIERTTKVFPITWFKCPYQSEEHSRLLGKLGLIEVHVCYYMYIV